MSHKERATRPTLFFQRATAARTSCSDTSHWRSSPENSTAVRLSGVVRCWRSTLRITSFCSESSTMRYFVEIPTRSPYLSARSPSCQRRHPSRSHRPHAVTNARRYRAHKAWKVDMHGSELTPPSADSTRCFNSEAALLVNDTATIVCGGQGLWACLTRCAIRATMTLHSYQSEVSIAAIVPASTVKLHAAVPCFAASWASKNNNRPAGALNSTQLSGIEVLHSTPRHLASHTGPRRQCVTPYRRAR